MKDEIYLPIREMTRNLLAMAGIDMSQLHKEFDRIDQGESFGNIMSTVAFIGVNCLIATITKEAGADFPAFLKESVITRGIDFGVDENAREKLQKIIWEETPDSISNNKSLLDEFVEKKGNDAVDNLWAVFGFKTKNICKKRLEKTKKQVYEIALLSSMVIIEKYNEEEHQVDQESIDDAAGTGRQSNLVKKLREVFSPKS